MTAAVGLLGSAIVLLSPTATRVVSRLQLCWNVEDFAGHLCVLAGCCYLVNSAVSRVARDDADQAVLMARTIYPVLYVSPLMFATFMMTNERTSLYPGLFETPTDQWLKAYWCMYALVTGWLTTVLIWALRIAYADTRSRGVVAWYLTGSVFGGMCAATSAANAFLDLPAEWGWLLRCVTIGIFAVTSGCSWHRRKVAFTTVRDDHPVVDA